MGAGEAPLDAARATARAARLTASSSLRRRAGDALVGAGFSEAIGWSFQAPEMARRAAARRARGASCATRCPRT